MNYPAGVTDADIDRQFSPSIEECLSPDHMAQLQECYRELDELNQRLTDLRSIPDDIISEKQESDEDFYLEDKEIPAKEDEINTFYEMVGLEKPFPRPFRIV